MSAPGCVLVAEDDERLQSLARKILEKRGYQVELAGDGPSALAAASRDHVGLVLMDVNLPGMDGLEVTRRLKAGRPLLPVIALTAHASEEHRQRCLAAGCDGYLAKPYAIGDLLDSVRGQIGEAVPAR